jgi:hypothetical protein
VTPNYPHTQKSLDTIAPISPDSARVQIRAISCQNRPSVVVDVSGVNASWQLGVLRQDSLGSAEDVGGLFTMQPESESEHAYGEKEDSDGHCG